MKNQFLVFVFIYFIAALTAHQAYPQTNTPKGATPINANEKPLEIIPMRSLSASLIIRILESLIFDSQIKMLRHLQITLDQVLVVNWMEIT